MGGASKRANRLMRGKQESPEQIGGGHGGRFNAGRQPVLGGKVQYGGARGRRGRSTQGK